MQHRAPARHTVVATEIERTGGLTDGTMAASRKPSKAGQQLHCNIALASDPESDTAHLSINFTLSGEIDPTARTEELSCNLTSFDHSLVLKPEIRDPITACRAGCRSPTTVGLFKGYFLNLKG
jgi:hypothetical protein